MSDISANEKVHQKEVERFLSNQKEPFTLGDASTVTGLPMLETKYALKELMRKYVCHLDVSKGGELIYFFGSSLKRRSSIPFQERLEKLGAGLWKVFKVVYKALIGITLVVYFVFFLVMIVVALVLMMSQGGRSDDGKGAIGGFMRMISEMFFSIFRWNTHHRSKYEPLDKWGYPYEHYEPRRTSWPTKKQKKEDADPWKRKPRRKKEKSFIASVYDFVFGPPRVPIHPLRNQRELAAFLRKNDGVCTVSEVQALAGWTRSKAAEFMTTCLAEFDGEATITENGTLVGTFESLIKGGADDLVEKIEWFWDEYVPEWEVTGNSVSRNIGIIAMNVFNLGVSGALINGVFAAFTGVSLGALVGLGWFPLIFSIVFFLVPAVRWFYVQKKQREQHVENIRRRLMKVIYKKHKQQISLEELTAAANNWRDTEEVLSPKVVDEVLKEFIYDLEGEATVNDKADIVYSFYRLNNELNDLQRVRLEAKKTRRRLT